MARKYKMIDDIIPDAFKMQRRRVEDISGTNGMCDMARLMPSGCLVADVAIQEKKSEAAKI